MMDLDALRSFVVFAEHLNFTHAADALCISQPALHIKIRKLSDTLGVTLYERYGKNLVLTEKGLEVLRFGRELIESTDSFQKTLIGGEHKPCVSLAAGEGTFLYILGPVIQQFRQLSDSRLKLMTANSEEVIQSVMSGSAHFGVTAATAYPEELKVTRLAKVPMVLVVPKNHALAKRKSVTVSQLAHLDLIVPMTDRPLRQLIDRHTQSAGVFWNIAVEANGWELMLHFVKFKLGFAVVNGSCTIPKGFVAIPFSDLPATQYHLLHRPNMEQATDRKALLQIIKRQFRLV